MSASTTGAAANIFGRAPSVLQGVFTADGVTLTANGVTAGSAAAVANTPTAAFVTLVQQLQIQYAQNITRLFEVGSNNMYYVGGRAQGQAQFNRVIGPKGGMCALYKLYGDVCQAANRNITLGLGSGGCGTTNTDNYTLTSCVISAVGIGVTANDIIITDMTTMMFAALEC